MLRRVEVDRVQLLVEEAQALTLEPLAPVAVGLVRERDAEHPVRDPLAVDDGLELCLGRRHLLLVGTRQVAEITLAREAPELGGCILEPMCRLEPRHLLVAGVDRLEVERLLVAGEVEIALLVELGDEAVGAAAKSVQVASC